jgi:hypothetical protein
MAIYRIPTFDTVTNLLGLGAADRLHSPVAGREAAGGGGLKIRR